MVRLRDIAERAGTSVSTVSIVLSERPSPVRISEETRLAVVEAARVLGYTPNLAARRLRRNGVQARTIVLAIAYPLDSRLSLVSRIVAGVQRRLNAMAEELAAVDVAVQLIIETFRPGQLHELRGLAEPLWFNGILVTNTSSADDAFLHRLTPGIPLVVFQRFSNHNSVNTDNVIVGQLAAKHLVGLGHRRTVVIAPDTDSQAQVLRIKGYEDALSRVGLVPRVEVAQPQTDWARGAHDVARALCADPPNKRPTAVFATNDLLAIGVIRAVRDQGLRVPEDISVVGCDDAEFAAYADPPLTTVHLPIEEMAARATTILLDLIYQRVTPPIQDMFSSHLVIRSSTGPYRD